MLFGLSLVPRSMSGRLRPGGFDVSDLLFVLLTVALFVVLGIVVKGVERL